MKLPGPSQKEPNKYAFGTPYKEIWEDLARKDTELYTRNGLLRNCQRNMEVKLAPERFQECQEPYDVVMTFEERVMDQVIDGGWCSKYWPRLSNWPGNECKQYTFRLTECFSCNIGRSAPAAAAFNAASAGYQLGRELASSILECGCLV